MVLALVFLVFNVLKGLTVSTTVFDAAVRLCVLALGVAAIAFGLRDILRFSPMRLWALAHQTFRESVRRRVLLLIPVFMALIVIFGLFQRGSDAIGVSDIHQATETCIRVSSALTLLLMILLSAFSFPREFESRTIYSLVTKPVTRLEVFLGKLLGLWLLAVFVLAVMGAFSYGYLRVRASQLAGRAQATLDQQGRDYQKYLVASSRPDAVSFAKLERYEPPDPSLEHQVKTGLLTAMNYIDSAPVRVHPTVPAEYQTRPRRWVLSGRGYVGVYVTPLPPVEARTANFALLATADVPSADPDETITAEVRMLLREDAKPNPGMPAWHPPAAIEAGGWPLGVGEPIPVPMKRGPDGLWHGVAELRGEFIQAIGPVNHIGMSFELPGRLIRLVGLLPAPERGSDPPGVVLIPQTATGLKDALHPTSLQVFPRSRSAVRFTISGPSPAAPEEVADYRFENINMDQLPDGPLVFQLRFNFDKGSPLGTPLRAIITAVNAAGRTLRLEAYPNKQLGSFVRVPRDFVDGPTLVLQIRPEHDEDSFNLAQRSIRLLAQPTGFAANLAKSLAVCLLQSFVVVAIGVMASVFLSWPVALLLTSVVLVAGNLIDMVRGILTQPGGADVFEVTGEDRSIDLVSRAANEFFKQASRVIEAIVPNFTRFDPVAYIGQGLNIPWQTIQSNAMSALLYLGVAMAIGYLVLRFKEVAR
ncbi:MAG: ABC transporter permease subunit [Phycisphaerae bacterium]|nr:ABC transporter permease subunit [Phycisphaerae bacterium]